ncbi:MAG: PaaI family thioesterase [Nocardia sp.]|nr:PaaI family thioesterase [Nocardia sp.]
MNIDTDAHPSVHNAPDGTVLTPIAKDESVGKATAAARRVVDALLRTDRRSADLERIAGELNRIAEHLEEHAPDTAERLIDMWRGEGANGHDPATGPENAIAPPLILVGREDGHVEGEVSLSFPYQGPPGHVHGGVSALLLDHTLGVANAWAGRTGATAQLSIRYHRPTPLFEPLTVRGRLVEHEGKKINSVGEIRTANGDLCVSVEALFIDKTVPRPR